MVAGTILFLWNKGEKSENITIVYNLAEIKSPGNTSDNIVNELLLSANELNIYGNGSFLDYNYRDNNQPGDLLIQQIKINPNRAYQTILKNKLEKLNKQHSSPSDFYIKPVPK
jgi:hypothetical protein